LQISTKSTAQFLSNSCFKNGTQKQKFPIWKILIRLLTSLSNRTMLQLTELVTPWSFFLAIHQISSHRYCGRPVALT